MQQTQELGIAAVVALRTSGRWEVDLQDGRSILFANSLIAELYAMRHVRQSGGGRVLIHDRDNRAPRVVEIIGEFSARRPPAP